MRRSSIVTILIAVAAAAGYGLSHFEKYEHSVIFVTSSAAYDPLGNVQNLYNRMSRNCSAVVEVQRQSTEWLEIQSELSQMKEPYPTEANPLRVMRLGPWYMAESEFVDLEPALFLLSRNEGKLHIHMQGTWSGTAAPLTPGPIIREYMQSKIPTAPKELINCFDPTLGHFSY